MYTETQSKDKERCLLAILQDWVSGKQDTQMGQNRHFISQQRGP